MTSEEIKNITRAGLSIQDIALLEIAHQLAVANEKDPPGVVRDGFHEQMVFRGEKAIRVACRCGWSTDLRLGTQPEFADKAFEKHEYAEWVRRQLRGVPA